MRHALSSSLARAAAAAPPAAPASFILLFRPLLHSGRAFAFPCDPHGRVDLDGMSERARNNYLYARAMMGRELAFPSVHAHCGQDAQGG